MPDSSDATTYPAPDAAATGRPPGRWLRVLAGVDEDLLDRVPQERARYTSLSGVIVGTATIAAFSMWFAISQTLGYTHPLILVPVLIWGAFVLFLDRWLVSSALGSGWSRRLSTLLMRLLVAGILGYIVAEPIVLRIFETAIEQHVRDERREQRAALVDTYVECNPEVAPQEASPRCDGYLLDLATPAKLAAPLEDYRTDAAQLRDAIEADTARFDELNDLARRECVGEPGTGLTGIPGVGPNCQRLREQADELAVQIGEQQSRLAELENTVDELESDLAPARSEFEQNREAAIAEQVAVLAAPDDRIGFQERRAALHELGIGTWLVRLFFVLVDCLPVLIKVFGGATSYDHLEESQRAAAERWHAVDLETEDMRRDAAARKLRAELDIEVREHSAGIRIRLGDAVDRLAERLAHERPNGARSGAVPQR